MANWKATLPIFISLIIAGLGSFFVYRWVQQQTVPQKVVEVEKEAALVVVAALDLAPGTKLTSEISFTRNHFSDFVLLFH
jgi:Flp pilus assembly protein CpaB